MVTLIPESRKGFSGVKFWHFCILGFDILEVPMIRSRGPLH
jgi:hypothetical protein